MGQHATDVYNPPVAFRLGYRPALDGVRALAILTVMVVHTGAPFISGGFLSVDVFFVLSGLLITTVLLEEWEKTATISLARFYARRALRLLPGLAVLLLSLAAFSFTLDPMFRPAAVEIWREIVFTFFYMANWALAFGAMPAMGFLGHAWTLAIEEQFYMIWPLLLLTMLRGGLSRRRVATIVAGAIAAAWFYRLVLWESGVPLDRLFFGFDARCDALLAGCLAGICASLPDRSEGASSGLRTASFVSGAFLAVMFVVADREAASMYQGLSTLVALATAVVLAEIVEHPATLLARVLAWPPLVHVGRVSYGLYLWHWPVYLYLPPETLGLSVTATNIVRFAMTFVMAELSSVLIERPALRMKSRWAAT